MPEGKMYIEKRVHERLSKAIKVTYKIISQDIETSTFEQLNGQTIDMSTGGARIEGEIVGKENEIIRIEFNSPKTNQPITVLAQIKWIKSENGTGQFGLQFTKLSIDEMYAIEELLED